MSVAPSHTHRFILTAAGDLLNVDYVVRLHISGGKLMADMASGPDVVVLNDLSLLTDLRQYLSVNARAT